MYVIFYAINTVKLAILVFYYSRNVLIQLPAISFINCRLSVLCSENDLIKDLTIATHAFICLFLEGIAICCGVTFYPFANFTITKMFFSGELRGKLG